MYRKDTFDGCVLGILRQYFVAVDVAVSLYLLVFCEFICLFFSFRCLSLCSKDFFFLVYPTFSLIYVTVF